MAFGWHIPCGICAVPQSCLITQLADGSAIWPGDGVTSQTPAPRQLRFICQRLPWHICASALVALLLLALSATVQAQLRYPDANGTISVECYTGAGGAVAIPSIINGLPVTSIGDRAFQDCTNLTNVTIPNSVTSIGQGAFHGCTSLASVSIGNSVTSIGQDAFGGCYSLTNVTIPNSVISIRDSAFCICPSLTRVTIPDSVTSIGQDAFNGCTSLTGVTIGSSVTSIGDGAFEGTSLTYITIPDSVTNIGNYAFYYCTNLTGVTIGSGVTSIGREAFWRCTSLTNMTIPNSVASIGQDAFGGCVKLARVYFKGDVPSPGDADVFDGDYIDPGLAVQAKPLSKPAPPPTVQSAAAIQLGRVIPVRNSPVMMALAGGLGVSALLALSVAHNQNGSRAKRRKLARMERDQCCRLCGEPAVLGAFCLKHAIADWERARKKLACKRGKNNNRRNNKLDAKVKAPARRKRTKKTK
jgi:hypothetical protein